jgi:hypothetical protein
MAAAASRLVPAVLGIILLQLVPPASASHVENLITNGTFGDGLTGYTQGVTIDPKPTAYADIVYDPSGGINTPDGAAGVDLGAEDQANFMPWIGVQFKLPASVTSLEFGAFHRVEVVAPNGTSALGTEILKLEDFGGRILQMESEASPHASQAPKGMSMSVPGSKVQAGASFTLKLFAVVNITAWENESASYRLWWDDVAVLAHFDDIAAPVVAGAVSGVAAVAGVAAFLVVRRRRSRRAEDVRIDDVFLLHTDGRLIKHYTRSARPDFDSEIVGSMLVAMEQFVKDALGKDEAGELTGIEFGGRKIRFVKGKRLLIAAVVKGRDEAATVARVRRALDTMEAENSSALEKWSGSSEEVGFANGHMEKLLAGGFDR